MSERGEKSTIVISEATPKTVRIWGISHSPECSILVLASPSGKDSTLDLLVTCSQEGLGMGLEGQREVVSAHGQQRWNTCEHSFWCSSDLLILRAHFWIKDLYHLINS